MQSNNLSPNSSRGCRSSRHSSESTNPTVYSPLETRYNKKQHGSNNYAGAYGMQYADIRFTPPYTPFNEGANALTGTFANCDPFRQPPQNAFMPQQQASVLGQGHRRPLPSTVFSTDVDPLTKDYESRYILIEAESHYEIDLVESKLKKYDIFQKSVSMFKSGRSMRIRFDDFRLAYTAATIARNEDWPCRVKFSSPQDYAAIKLNSFDSADPYEGQVTMDFEIRDVQPTDQALNMIERAAHDCARRFGDVRALLCVGRQEYSNIVTFRIEFYSVEAAKICVSFWTRFSNPVDMECGSATLVGVDLYTSRIQRNDSVLETGQTSPCRLRHNHPQSPASNPSEGPHRFFGEKSHCSMPPPANDIGAMMRKNNWNANNTISRYRIEAGLDVRTTIMLRNIPNKMDCAALKDLVDIWCRGSYDFMYLRIDFSTGSNVGYAFINFSRPEGMINVVNFIEGQPWKGYKSDKYAEISYATIQGKEALIQKFRNSSVILEWPHCRPKLFYTFEEALAEGNILKTGTEREFPAPDNWAKLQRSIENAKNVGLFPPKSGPHGSADHRDRHSMYDRGTPRDLDMTNYYQQQLSQMNHPGNNGWHASNFAGAIPDMRRYTGSSTATGHQNYGFVGAPQNFSDSPHGSVGQKIGTHHPFSSHSSGYGRGGSDHSGQNGVSPAAHRFGSPCYQEYQFPHRRGPFY